MPSEVHYYGRDNLVCSQEELDTLVSLEQAIDEGRHLKALGTLPLISLVGVYLGLKSAIREANKMRMTP